MKQWLDYLSNIESNKGGENLPLPPRHTADKMIQNVLDSLQSKKLRDGYASYIMEQAHFHHWILLAKEDIKLWSWFQSFLDNTLDLKISETFYEACRLVMNQLLEFGKD